MHPRQRIFRILTAASGIVACFLVFVLLFSYTSMADSDVSPAGWTMPASIPLGTRARGGVYRGGIWFFTGDLPYMGGIIRLSDESEHKILDWGWYVLGYGCVQTTYVSDGGDFVSRDRGADLPGVYYRHFEGRNQPQPWTTLRVSLWIPIVLFAVLPALWFVRQMVRLCAREQSPISPAR